MLRRLAVLFVLAAALSSPARADLKLPRVSPKATVTQTLGLTELGVVYSRPGVKQRTIWGDLVPYDKPWRTGANEATTFTCSDEIQFGGQKLPAGTYSLFTIPGRDGWMVALNSEKDLWGTDYKPEKDLFRIPVKPAEAPHEEWLRFSFENLGAETCDLVLRWEKLEVAVPIRADVNGRALAAARDSIAILKPTDWRTPYQAASFAFNNDLAMDEGQQWLKRSLAIQPNFQNLTLQARWQMKLGDRTAAIATAKKAVAAGKASKDKVDTASTEKLISDWTAAR